MEKVCTKGLVQLLNLPFDKAALEAGDSKTPDTDLSTSPHCRLISDTQMRLMRSLESSWCENSVRLASVAIIHSLQQITHKSETRKVRRCALSRIEYT